MEVRETPPSGDEELRAEMSAKAINDLPDSDFAYIEPGGTKDSEGKTVPRSKRHFPIHDEAHVRNALSRAPQSPFGEKAMPKIKAAAKKFGIDVSGDSQRNNQALVAAERRRKERHRAVPLLPEVRHFKATGLEMRSGNTTDEIVISGTPIVYDMPYSVRDAFGEFQERMSPGVASDALARGADVRFLFDHEGMPLARSTSGTMTLADTAEGLTFRASLDLANPNARALESAIRRGDVSQMSCGFIVDQDEWDDAMESRTIHRFADLLDVSAVTYPASPTTSIQIAQRMMLAAPVESRARIRKLYADIRAGKVLNQANQDRLVNAIGTLHDIASNAGVDLSPIDPDQDGDVDGPAPTSIAELEEPGEPMGMGVMERSADTVDATDLLARFRRSEARRRLQAA